MRLQDPGTQSPEDLVDRLRLQEDHARKMTLVNRKKFTDDVRVGASLTSMLKESECVRCDKRGTRDRHRQSNIMTQREFEVHGGHVQGDVSVAQLVDAEYRMRPHPGMSRETDKERKIAHTVRGDIDVDAHIPPALLNRSEETITKIATWANDSFDLHMPKSTKRALFDETYHAPFNGLQFGYAQVPGRGHGPPTQANPESIGGEPVGVYARRLEQRRIPRVEADI